MWIGVAALATLAWGCGSSGDERGEVREAHEVHSEAAGCQCPHGEECQHPEGQECEHHAERHAEGAEGHECNCRRGQHEHHGEHGEHHGERGEHHGEHGEGGEHGHAPGPVSDFHAVLSPLWHAERGAARTDGACAAVADFRAKAQAIQSGAVPEPARADEAGYRQAAAGLVAAVDALGTACGEAGRASFDARFEAVHVAFHGVAERASGE